MVLTILPVWAQADIVVAAPAAWARTMIDLLEEWKSGGGAETSVVYGDSDDQAVEIEVGAVRYDLLIASDPHAIYRARSKDKLLSVLPLASTPLVLVVSDRDKGLVPPVDHNFVALLGKGRLAVCDPDTNEVGAATRDVLSQEGVWEPLQNHLIILPASRAVIRAVHSGEARFGIALRADLIRAEEIHEGGSLGDGAVPELMYSVAPIVGHLRPEVRRFVEFLRSPTAARIFVTHGFVAQSGEN